MKKLWRSLLAAGITTGLAFAAVSASRFRGIAEMGWMAGLGIFLSLLAYLLLFPSLAIVLDAIRSERGALLRRFGRFSLGLPSRGLARVLVVGGVIAAIAAGAVAAVGVSMERDFRNLRADVNSPIRARGALGGTNAPAVYLLGEDPEALARTSADLVARRFDGLGDEGSVRFFSPSLLLPANQQPKLALFARMRVAVDGVLEQAEGEDRERLRSLRRRVAAEEPLGPDSLPPSMRRALTEDDGTFGTLAVIYPPLSGADGADMERLASLTADWRARYPEVLFASPKALLGEVLPALAGDAWLMIGLALLGLVLATGIIGRSVERTVFVLLPVVVAIAICGGLMVLFGMKVNLYNTLVFPIAFGMGIDGAVYITWATIDAPDRASFAERFRTAARAVIGAGVTSLCAFGSLAVSGTPGLASIGTLAMLAIGMTLLTNLVWMPSAILLRRGFDRRRETR